MEPIKVEYPDSKVYPAICAVNSEIGAIGKDRYNSFQKYKFRGIDDIYEMIHPLLAKHNLFVGVDVLDERSEEFESSKGTRTVRVVLRIQYSLIADDGSQYSAVVVAEGVDTSDKATYKAMSGGQKYFFLQTFTIPTDESKDPEDDHVDVATPKKTEAISQESPEALYRKCMDGLLHLSDDFPDFYSNDQFEKDKATLDVMRKEKELPGMQHFYKDIRKQYADYKKKQEDDNG